MQEVLKKAQELISLLEEKNRVAEVLNRQLNEKKLQLEEVEAKTLAKFNHASAMERVYKKYENFDKVQKEFAVKAQDLEARIKKVQEQEYNDDKVLKKIEEENKKLDARKLVLNKQAEALDKKEAELNEAKAQLKSFMNGDSLKGILK